MGRRTSQLLYLTIVTCILLAVFALWQFRPPTHQPALPSGYVAQKAAWLSIEWGMGAQTAAEMETLVQSLRDHNITYIFPYVSYLKPDGIFNPTFDHAAAFTMYMKTAAPEIKVLGWVGVPLQITTPDGVLVENRLDDSAVRQQVAEFSHRVVTEFGFDGVHLNAEMSFNDDPYLIQTLQMIRTQIP